jgi:hypothetical protein
VEDEGPRKKRKRRGKKTMYVASKESRMQITRKAGRFFLGSSPFILPAYLDE